MLEDYNELSEKLEERFPIGRIAYCVFLILPVWIFVHLAFFGDGMNNLFVFFIFASIICLISVPLMGIGMLNSAWSRHSKKLLIFWATLTTISAIPFFWLVGLVGLGLLCEAGVACFYFQ
jgi:hypothetical protein